MNGTNDPQNLPPAPPAPERAHAAEDTGSQALAEALKSSFVIVKVIMVVLVVVFFASGVFTVPPQEKALILRFGRAIGTGEKQLLGPGLHWSFPYPIDEVQRIPSGQVQTVESTAGWYATTREMELAGTEPMPGPSLNPASEGYTLTADGNIIHVRATLTYRISDPLAYVLKFVNASNVVQNVLNRALFHASAQFTVDEVLRGKVLEFQEKVLALVRQEVDRRGLGISIDQGTVRAIAPRQVQPQFEAVLSAEVDRRKAIEEAQGHASSVVSTAQGEAIHLINAGESERARTVQGIAAEAKYFENQLPHYEKNPALFLARLQVDTLGRVLTNAQDKILVPQRRDGKPRELRLQLNREPLSKKAPEPGAGAPAGPPPPR